MVNGEVHTVTCSQCGGNEFTISADVPEVKHHTDIDNHISFYYHMYIKCKGCKEEYEVLMGSD